MATKKPIYAKARPKRLGKPKSFNKKSKAYKSAKRKADKKFGKKVSKKPLSKIASCILPRLFGFDCEITEPESPQ